MRYLIYRLSVSWWVSIWWGLSVCAATGLAAGMFALWRFCSETGPWRYACAMPGYPGTIDYSCSPADHEIHHGWGYLPTSIGALLIAFTIFSLVVVMDGSWRYRDRDRA